MLNEYPHSDLWRQSIVEYWKPYVALDPQGVALCAGAYDGIYAVNTLFLRCKCKGAGGMRRSFRIMCPMHGYWGYAYERCAGGGAAIPF
jgi:hypothetical protein